MLERLGLLPFLAHAAGESGNSLLVKGSVYVSSGHLIVFFFEATLSDVFPAAFFLVQNVG